jgi:hypothetical protein
MYGSIVMACVEALDPQQFAIDNKKQVAALPLHQYQVERNVAAQKSTLS